MKDDWIIEYVTTFTFLIIFFFLYIRHKMTYFTRNKQRAASTPNYPFGNVYDAIFLRNPIFVQLWKFYLRFKKRKYKFGGFFIYLRPCYMIANADWTKTVLSSPDFRFVDEKTVRPIDQRVVRKIAGVLTGSWPSLEAIFHGEEINFTVVMSEFVIKTSAELFSAIEDDDFRRRIQGAFVSRSKSNNFRRTLNLAYPNRWWTNTKTKNSPNLAYFCQYVDEMVVNRKKHDVKTDDLLALLVKEDTFEANELGMFVYSLVGRLKLALDLVLLALYEMALNRDIQDELRGEILRFKKEKSANFDNINDLEYLETIACELLRKYPVAPFVAKEATKDCGDFKSGDLVFCSIFGMHHDSDYYLNPEKFDPDRFSQENVHFVDKNKYYPCATPNEEFELLYIKTIIKVSLIELIGNFKLNLGKKMVKALIFEEACNNIKLKNDVWLKIVK